MAIYSSLLIDKNSLENSYLTKMDLPSNRIILHLSNGSEVILHLDRFINYLDQFGDFSSPINRLNFPYIDPYSSTPNYQPRQFPFSNTYYPQPQPNIDYSTLWWIEQSHRIDGHRIDGHRIDDRIKIAKEKKEGYARYNPST